MDWRLGDEEVDGGLQFVDGRHLANRSNAYRREHPTPGWPHEVTQPFLPITHPCSVLGLELVAYH